MKKSTNKGEPLCPKCISWDYRPEEGLGIRSGYCIARDIVTSYRYECEQFQEATDRLREERKRALYGEFPGYEEHNLEG